MPTTLDQKTVDPHQGLEPPSQKTRSKNRWWLWLLMLATLGAAGYWLLQQRGHKSPANPQVPVRSASQSVPVAVASVRKGEMAIYLNGLGSVTAFNTVTVKSRVDGYLVKVAFQEGQFVHEGDLLAEIDPRPFQVQLEQAQGQLARDQAQLRDATVTLARYRELFGQGVVSRQEVDDQDAKAGQFQGAIRADQAQIDNAALQLTYARVTAPISGRAGLRLVDVGNVVHANDTGGIVVLTQLRPIAVLFTVP